MAEISCKHCSSLDCRGCNIYRLEQMLDAGKLDPLMNENRVIQISADVAPVKHGKWLKRDDMPRIVECKCSVCGYADYPSKSDRYWFERNYCPNCGAKMDGGQDDA